jgi:hypothetical protein
MPVFTVSSSDGKSRLSSAAVKYHYRGIFAGSGEICIISKFAGYTCSLYEKDKRLFFTLLFLYPLTGCNEKLGYVQEPC